MLLMLFFGSIIISGIGTAVAFIFCFVYVCGNDSSI